MKKEKKHDDMHGFSQPLTLIAPFSLIYRLSAMKIGYGSIVKSKTSLFVLYFSQLALSLRKNWQDERNERKGYSRGRTHGE
ncbi:MAG: hypothetical protein IKX22_02880 [Prevotella sp.]|nr:hypothetical protein [Prevotella sp.]